MKQRARGDYQKCGARSEIFRFEKRYSAALSRQGTKCHAAEKADRTLGTHKKQGEKKQRNRFAGTNRQPHPMIKPGTQYNSESLATAVKRGCDRAGIARFTPYDLRRSAATRVRSVLDKDAANLLLGHVSTETTEIYLLDEVKEAMNVAMKLEKKKVQE